MKSGVQGVTYECEKAKPLKIDLTLQCLKAWEAVANDTMAVLAETPGSVIGRPWDNAHYLHEFRVEGSTIYLKAAVSNRCISGCLIGLTDISVVGHPWGTALILHGPVRWVGTQIIQPRGLLRMISRYLPFLGAPKQSPYDGEWPQMTLVLPRHPEQTT